MKVLYLSTVFPKISDSSTIYTDLAEELVARGHQVTVVAAEEKKKSEGTRIVNERGCRILRVKTGNMYDVNIIEKGISVLLLETKMRNALCKHLSREEFDLILFESPPLTLTGVVEKAKELFSAPAFLMMKDIFPQNAVDIGMIKKGGIIHRFFKAKEKRLYKVADQIGCMSEENKRYIAEHNNIPLEKLSIFPNTKKIAPIPKKNKSFRRDFHLPEDKIIFIFGGNMGKPQGMEFLAKSIRQAENTQEAFFVLVGRGTEKGKVKRILKDCSNSIIIDNLSRNDYEKLVSCCDVGIVSLDYRFTIPNYPSRILSYFEFEMPVLCVTDESTDMKELILDNNCGLWCSSCSEKDFINCLVALIKDENLRKEMGINGRRLLERVFSVEKSVQLLENFLLLNKKK